MQNPLFFGIKIKKSMPDKKKYLEILERAVEANRLRSFFAQYPEHPKAYPAEAPEKGAQAFRAHLNKDFDELLQGTPEGRAGEEVSPFTREALGIRYPLYSVETLLKNAAEARSAWRKETIEERALILVDALERIKERFFEIANATMHTTGQGWVMSFQASGPHSNDRALEALAMAYEELTRFPREVDWVKPMGKFEIKVHKSFHPVGKGISLAIGCSTFPVWNSVPGIFAGLATGNPVIVKPHPGAVYPLAIVIAELQQALLAAGHDPKTVQLAVDPPGKLIAKELAESPEVKIIDYTGGNEFGDYLESLKGKEVFTEKAGVNSVIFDSVKNLDAVVQNLAFSVSLYSGQMCTAPQNFYIPQEGILENGERIPYEEVVNRLRDAVYAFARHPKMGPGTLGAIQNERTLKRVQGVDGLEAEVLLAPEAIENPEFANARTCAPSIIEVDAGSELIREELFGPLIQVIKTRDTEHSLQLAHDIAMEKGAITCAAYTTDEETAKRIEERMEEAFVPVSFNLTGYIWVNQNAAFSDFHVTGGNPAGNASLADPNFVNRRFVWVGHRKLTD